MKVDERHDQKARRGTHASREGSNEAQRMQKDVPISVYKDGMELVAKDRGVCK